MFKKKIRWVRAERKPYSKYTEVIEVDYDDYDPKKMVKVGELPVGATAYTTPWLTDKLYDPDMLLSWRHGGTACVPVTRMSDKELKVGTYYTTCKAVVPERPRPEPATVTFEHNGVRVTLEYV